MEGIEVSLAKVLSFREWKASIQESMFLKWKNEVVVSISMNIPGPVKTSPLIHDAFKEGMSVLENMFEQKNVLIRQKITIEQAGGYAAIYATENMDRIAMKKEAVVLEENHPLGRIFDIDVIAEDGAILRQEVGALARKCLICEEKAKVCGRSRAHSVEELQNKVVEIMQSWKAGE